MGTRTTTRRCVWVTLKCEKARGGKKYRVSYSGGEDYSFGEGTSISGKELCNVVIQIRFFAP